MQSVHLHFQNNNHNFEISTKLFVDLLTHTGILHLCIWVFLDPVNCMIK